jgi:hypothetical protein
VAVEDDGNKQSAAQEARAAPHTRNTKPKTAPSCLLGNKPI